MDSNWRRSSVLSNAAQMLSSPISETTFRLADVQHPTAQTFNTIYNISCFTGKVVSDSVGAIVRA